MNEGGHLALVSSAISNTQLKNLNLSTFWLGGTNQLNGKWSWIDGSNLSYFNWAIG